MNDDVIVVRGARQNNLRDLNLEIPIARMTVVTGVSGSGKSSLAFDTIYAEGQRRYVETFSAYTRQFFDRMDRPAVDEVAGVPPAIAVDQTNPVRTSRSTVGTMTELNDYLKLLYARAAQISCRRCHRDVQFDSPKTIISNLLQNVRSGDFILITFEVTIPDSFSWNEVRILLSAKGYHRFHAQHSATATRPRRLEVVQDRVTVIPQNLPRIVEDLETAFEHGHGQVVVRSLDVNGRVGRPRRFSTELHCAVCNISYGEPTPSMFSFNSPVGACDRCRGFGRIITIDYDLVIPDSRLSIEEGAVRPWQSQAYAECQDDLIRFARKRSIPTEVPWIDLPVSTRRWVIDGEGDQRDGCWYGVKRFFDWLERRSYRMHVRVMLSRYRAYVSCPVCQGTRLKPGGLLWRLGGKPGRDIHEVALMPITECRHFFGELSIPTAVAAAVDSLLTDVHTRLGYLEEVGLGYLTLDRQSRTLSGGEVQRINLTTALGTQLVNTLFVLDEPSIGLHQRDIGQMISVLHRLRDAGNTLLIVEHDAAVIRAADHIIELGPGPGRGGGRIEFQGSVKDLQRSQSLTGRYLSGRLGVLGHDSCQKSSRGNLVIRGACANNLKGIDVDFPLGSLVCLAGVSGSGKSTLLADILFPAVRRAKGQPAEAPGAHGDLVGHSRISAIELIDQSPIGKSARSTPATYVKAFDPIRALFAATDTARSRGYTAGTFSFNAGNGRCPTCSGAGFEHVEMQFLSDVYLRCPDCDGDRFRPDISDVRVHNRTIVDVLSMTVDEAQNIFDDPAVQTSLRPLNEVGLGYLSLGQSVPTLSGGEAQRLKIAGHLANATRSKPKRDDPDGVLFLMDEPTTGLHFADISVLINALRQIVAAGNSLIVVEHNLDLLTAADHIIELGPEGGEFGGQVVATGSCAELTRTGQTHTSVALRDHQRQKRKAEDGELVSRVAMKIRNENAIQVRGAREHNLRNFDLKIPRDQFTVVTGVSGSGKSSLAFDVLFAEGQRRYLESLNAYVRQFVQPASRPDIDGLSGMPPAVAIEQRTSSGGLKSTVATLTEIYHILRLLYVKLGVQHCPDCYLPVESQSARSIVSGIINNFDGREVMILAPLVNARKGYYTDLAAWAARKGISRLMVDGHLLMTEPWPRLDRFREHDIDALIATVLVNRHAGSAIQSSVEQALEYGRGMLNVRYLDDVPSAVPYVFSTRRSCPGCRKSFSELDPRQFSFNSKHGWCPSCCGTGLDLPEVDAQRSGSKGRGHESWDGTEVRCSVCDGNRLRPESLAVTLSGQAITELTAMSVQALPAALRKLSFDQRQRLISRDIIDELLARVTFLLQVGIGYLGLDRAAPTLSGGEAQRIRLAAQLGSPLRGVCYVLDEPSIGMHARDNHLLLVALRSLQQRGNTVIVVEHDEETIRTADHIVDLGPGGGIDGGVVVAQGTVAEIIANKDSTTGKLLRVPIKHPLITRRRNRDVKYLTIREARLNNLCGIDVHIPIGSVTCVTGVSGSGKSTLVRKLLYEQVRERLSSGREHQADSVQWRGCRAIDGWKAIGRVLQVDQTPIGKTPRSCPATYVGIWDEVRSLYASTPEARIRGYSPSRFSFNVEGGRCVDCGGQGIKKIEMNFLPDVTISCEGCGGNRFDQETLSVRVHGQSVAEVLEMDTKEAAEFFVSHPRIGPTLNLLVEVGLGYLKLGQPSPTLSGGEAQRIKIVAELARRAPVHVSGTGRRGTLYVLDEPTIGLHMADVERLTRVLHRLADRGHTVVVIEHNLDMIAEADHIIDLGPDAGDGGGHLVAIGSPEEVAAVEQGSYTALALSSFLRERVE